MLNSTFQPKRKRDLLLVIDLCFAERMKN